MKRVLLVEDNIQFRRALSLMLARLDYDSVGVDGVPAALRVLGKTHINVILLDLHLRGHSGHSLLRGLDRTGLDLPVIVMSGVGRMQDVVKALRHNAVDWLTKPFGSEELREALQRALQADREEGRSSRRNRRSEGHRGATGDQSADPAPHAGGPGGGGAEDASEPKEESPQRLCPKEFQRALGRLDEQIQDGTLHLPPLDPVALELQALFENPAPDLGEVLAVVERDPAVAATILRLANSIRFQGGIAVSTLKAACIRLGNRRVLAIAQEVMVKELFSGGGAFGELANAMWENVLVTSQGARLLAERLPGLDPDEVHLAALFHNMGELVLLRVFRTLVGGRQASDEDLALFADEMEKRHEEVGALLLRTWGIFPGFVRLAGCHHKEPLAPETPEVRLLRHVVFAAWQMALREDFTYLPGQDGVEPPPTVEELGLKWEEVEDLFSRAKGWVG